MAAQNKANRESENRSGTERAVKWRNPELLPSPDPQDGYVFRWVRVASLGNSDPSNTSSKLREGWVPVKAEDHPELMVQAVSGGRYAGCVEIGGLLLCKIPQEFMIDREAHYSNLSASQMRAIDNDYFREQDEQMPTLFKESTSKVSRFGSGT